MNLRHSFAALLTLTALGLGAAVAQDSRPARTTAPEFTLTDLSGKSHSLSDYTKQGKVVVLEWFNPGCPFVKKHHQFSKTMANTYAKYKDKNVAWLAINSGSPGKQGTGKETNVKAKTNWRIAYPILFDESGEVGRKYGAKVTPHMFVIGTDGKIAYEGAIDNDRSAKTLGTVNYVDAALEALLAGKPVAEAVARPYGCSVKYGK